MAIFRKAAERILGKAARVTRAKPAAPDAGPVASPAGNSTPGSAASGAEPIANLVLADIALRGGGALLRRAVEGSLLGKAAGSARPRKVIKGKTMTQTLVGTALVRIAARSVPGAIVIGGGLLAKTLYDRKRARKAAENGTPPPGDPAEQP